MANLALRKSVVQLAKLRADAIAQGKTKQSEQCGHEIENKKLHRMVQSTNDKMNIAQVNWELKFCKADFDENMINKATHIEGWGTNFACEDEFTLWVLIGKDGYLAHRIVNGY